MDAIKSSMVGAMNPADMIRQRMAQADTDGDGKFSLEEFQAAAPSKRPEGAPEPEELFSQFDSDGDGYLSEQELGDGIKSMGPPPGMGNGQMFDQLGMSAPGGGQALMSSGMISTLLMSLSEQMDGLTEKVDTLSEQIDQILNETDEDEAEETAV